MTSDLYWLTATLLLVGSQWIPFIVGVNMHLPNSEEPFDRPPNLRTLPDWVQRANRAHLNALEQTLPFAGLVVITHLSDLSTSVTGWTCAIFFWLRLAHAVGMTTGWTKFPARPILFASGWVCTMVVGLSLLLA